MPGAIARVDPEAPGGAAASPDGADSARGWNGRAARSKSKILAAATDLLVERGFAGASVDEISRRSGVAKTTIYRHWPTRADLLRDACAALGTPQATPDTGSLRGDALDLVGSLATVLTTAAWTAVIPSIIDAAERDPEVAVMHAELQRGYSAPFQTIIARALARGELPGDTDVATLIASLTGPLFYRRWFSREALDFGFVQRVVGRVIP